MVGSGFQPKRDICREWPETPAIGLIHHYDRGSQHCSYEYQELLERSGMRASMSRKGN